MIARRDLLVALAGAALAPSLTLRAQSASGSKRVHFLYQGADASAPGQSVLLEALRARGWNEGRNFSLQAHADSGRQDNLPRIAAEILRAAPDLVIANGPTTALALKSAGASVPVVFISVFDPVGLGLVESLARPGGSFTGLSTAVPETFFGKQLDLLREAVPKATRLALLSNPRNPIHVLFRDRRLEWARKHSFEPIEVHASTSEELEAAFPEAARRGAGAMYVGGDALPLAHRPLVARLALHHRLATLFLFKSHVEDGGLMSYGTDTNGLTVRAADYVDRILRGAKPADLPVEQPTKFELVINLKTAKALGLALPQSLLISADRVIE